MLEGSGNARRNSDYQHLFVIMQVPVYANLAEGQAVFTANYSDLTFTWTFLEVAIYTNIINSTPSSGLRVCSNELLG